MTCCIRALEEKRTTCWTPFIRRYLHKVAFKNKCQTWISNLKLTVIHDITIWWLCSSSEILQNIWSVKNSTFKPEWQRKDGSVSEYSSVTTMKSDIYFMRHCLLTVIIPAGEHSETLNTSTTQYQSKKSVRKVCWKSPGPADVWIQPTPSSDE